MTPPPFVVGGTFIFARLGYQYSSPLPPDWQKTVPATSAWHVLISTLERAKRGDRSGVSSLVPWLEMAPDNLFLSACTAVLADASSAADLELLVPVMRSASAEAAAKACEAASLAGALWLTPELIDCWQRLRDADSREWVGYALRRLLEPEGGPISDAIMSEPDEFVPLVRSTFDKRRAELGTDRVRVWDGEVFGVVRLAKRMQSLLANIENESEAVGLFIPLRHKFEASTGIDCSTFFKDRRLQPLSAAAILEDCLEGPTDIFVDGSAYFFAHRISD